MASKRARDARERSGKELREQDTIDPRWHRLMTTSFRCASCGQDHRGLFDLACSKPDIWRGSDEQRPNSELLEANDAHHILTEDFCVVNGEHCFVRCVMPVPVLRAPADVTFSYGVWSTLSQKNFDQYVATFDEGEQAGLGPWFGWFSNRLRGYPDTLHLKCRVNLQNDRQRPWLELEPTDHPLAVEQREGITFDRLLEIYALYGHDLREAFDN